MVRLIKHSLVLLVLLVILDRLAGNVLEYFFYNQDHGDDYVTTQVLDSTKADVLILGSSRASHHYVPDTIAGSTAMSCYNGGRDNMGIHFTYACLKEVFKRYSPKVVVLDIIPYNYLLDHQHNQTYYEIQTSALLPYCAKHQGLYEDVASINPWEVWKCRLIKTYAYNSLAGSIAQNVFTQLGHKQVKGYEPVYGRIDAAHYGKQLFPYTTIDAGIDKAAFKILGDCLAMCNQKGVKAVICFSPFYFPYRHESELLDEFNQLSIRYNSPILDYSSDSLFTNKPEMFYDELHLNHQGASLFSKKVREKLED